MKIKSLIHRMVHNRINLRVFALFFSVLAANLSLTSMVYGQSTLNRLVSFHLDKATLVETLEKLSAQENIRFMYAADDIKDKNVQSLNVDKKSLKLLLNTILSPHRLFFEEDGTYILIRKKSDKEKLTTNRIITGVVKDEKGLPLPGVSVKVKGTSRSTKTDESGIFRIAVNTDDILLFTYLNYKTSEILVHSETSLNIILFEEHTDLSEVVVIGYGTQRKFDLTGSVSIVDQKKFNDLPVASIDEKLIGQIAGVRIQQPTGAPGGGTTVQIRGSGSLGAGNEPLYVIDGMPYAAGLGQNFDPLIYLNSDDVESVSVLKDASATAIYGSRGANGVILITTKKATKNKTQVTANTYFGIQSVPNKGRPKMMNAKEFAEFQQDRIGQVILSNYKRAPQLQDYPVEYRNPDSLLGKGTDWYDLILRNGQITNNYLNILKGTDDSKIGFSVGYFNQQGVINYTGLKRYTSKLDYELSFSQKLKVGASLNPSYVQQNSTVTNTNRLDVIGISIWANPVASPYDAEGNLLPYIQSPKSIYREAWSFPNPLYVLKNTSAARNDFRNFGIAYAEWQIIPNVFIKTSLNTIWNTSKTFQYIPSTIGSTNTPPAEGTGQSTNIRSEGFNWLIENTLTYNKTIKEHRFDLLAGYTVQKNSDQSITIKAGPYENDVIKTLNAAPEINSWNESKQKWAMISYLARINYSFRQKYLLTGTFRSDGSSRFGSSNRYANFPSVAIAWNINAEDFMKKINVLDELKLRLSYGLSGNNNIGNYSSIGAINFENYVFDNDISTAAYVGQSNQFLRWEKSNEFDAGLDFSAYRNRLRLTLDYYLRKSNDMLLNAEVPSITGFKSKITNAGSVENNGIEIAVGLTPLSGAFQWELNANATFNKNKVISLDAEDNRLLSGNKDGFPTSITTVGNPIGQFYGFVYEGIYTEKDNVKENLYGTPKIRDIDGDGKITDLLDYTTIGTPHPKYTFGISNSFSFKGFDLSLLINGQHGGNVVNGLRQTTYNIRGFFNVSKDFINRYRNTDNPGNGYLYGNPANDSGGHNFSSLWIEDASYFRISNVTFGYTLNKLGSGKPKIFNNYRIYFTIQNLATFTSYSGGNPEGHQVDIDNTLAPGWDMTSYPLSRTVSLGVSLNL